jgi:hypothetical protein
MCRRLLEPLDFPETPCQADSLGQAFQSQNSRMVEPNIRPISEGVGPFEGWPLVRTTLIVSIGEERGSLSQTRYQALTH